MRIALVPGLIVGSVVLGACAEPVDDAAAESNDSALIEDPFLRSSCTGPFLTVEAARAKLQASTSGEVVLGAYAVSARTRMQHGTAPAGPWTATSGWGASGTARLRWNTDHTALEVFLESNGEGHDQFGYPMSKASAVCKLSNATDDGGEYTFNVSCEGYTYRAYNEIWHAYQRFPAAPQGLGGLFAGVLREKCMRLRDRTGSTPYGGGWVGGGSGGYQSWRKDFEGVLASKF